MFMFEEILIKRQVIVEICKLEKIRKIVDPVKVTIVRISKKLYSNQALFEEFQKGPNIFVHGP